MKIKSLQSAFLNGLIQHIFCTAQSALNI